MKTIKKTIGDFEINIIQFPVLVALNLRKELVKNIREQISDIEIGNIKEIDLSKMDASVIIKLVAGILYETPSTYFIKLFKNCSALGLGGINESNFDKVFSTNLDGPIELALEVIKLNGFFSPTIISTIMSAIMSAVPTLTLQADGIIEKEAN